MDSSNSAADRKLEQKANNERRAAALAKLNEDLSLQKTKKLKVVDVGNMIELFKQASEKVLSKRIEQLDTSSFKFRSPRQLASCISNSVITDENVAEEISDAVFQLALRSASSESEKSKLMILARETVSDALSSLAMAQAEATSAGGALVEAKSTTTRRGFDEDAFVQLIKSGDLDTAMSMIDNSRGSGYHGRSAIDYPGQMLHALNLATQMGPDGDGGNGDWMLYNGLIDLKRISESNGVRVVTLLDAIGPMEGGFILSPIKEDKDKNIVDPRVKKLLGEHDNWLELLSHTLFGKRYREGLAPRVLHKEKGWKRNSRTDWKPQDFQHHGAGRKAHVFHKKGANWRTGEPDRFGDKVNAEMQRKNRAARKSK